MTGFLRVILSQGFRAFFLGAGVFGFGAMGVWTVWLVLDMTGGGSFALPPYWHAHEMIFGYAGAAIAGFFLTAVPGWTGTASPRLSTVALAIMAWILGRGAVAFADVLGTVPTAILDLAFLPILGTKMAVRLIRRPKPQNVLFLGILAIIWMGNVAFHLGYQDDGLRTGILGTTALIAVLGGRVTPAFTRNALVRSGVETGLPRSRREFDIPGVVLAILLPVFVLVGAPEPAVGVTAIGAGVFQVLRLSGWRTAAVLVQPILWSLHLGFAMLGAGYLFFGLARFGLLSETAALHVLGIGAVGGMTVAVMSRAILGHSGLALIVSRRMAMVYALVAAAAVVRAIAEGFSGTAWQLAILIAAALWIVAFSLFIADVWPMVTRERLRDG